MAVISDFVLTENVIVYISQMRESARGVSK